MKLKLIERDDTRKSADPRVSVSVKGTIYVNSSAMKMLKFNDEVKYQFFQDEENAQAWFILPTAYGGYFSLSPKNNKDASAQAHVSDIAKKIISSFHHIGKKSLKFKLKEPIEFQGRGFFPLEIIKESIEMEIPNPNGPLPRK